MADGELIGVKSTRADKDKKGRDRLVLTFEPEQVEQIIQRLQSEGKNGKRVKLTVHTGEKETEDGRAFLSSFMFINEVQPFGQGAGAPQKGSFKPKAKGMSAETKASAARTLNTEVE